MSYAPERSIVTEERMASQRDDETIFPMLRLSGELDAASSPQLREQLGELTKSDHTAIVDLQDVTFIGSAPLGLLIALDAQLKSLGGALAVVVSNEQLRHIFDLSGADTRLRLFWNASEALEFLRSLGPAASRRDGSIPDPTMGVI
jgi:anti-anti-sigma factor